jgi:uncharacterized membrane protein YagU involved in acid resistance
VQHLFGVLIVVVHHVLAVPLGGGRARAFVEDGFDFAELFPAIIWIRKSSLSM